MQLSGDAINIIKGSFDCCQVCFRASLFAIFMTSSLVSVKSCSCFGEIMFFAGRAVLPLRLDKQLLVHNFCFVSSVGQLYAGKVVKFSSMHRYL